MDFNGRTRICPGLPTVVQSRAVGRFTPGTSIPVFSPNAATLNADFLGNLL